MKLDLTYYPNLLCPLKNFLSFLKKLSSDLAQFSTQLQTFSMKKISYIFSRKKPTINKFLIFSRKNSSRISEWLLTKQ